MKFISWNVNGIRACLGKGFLDFVAQENPDVLCLQETKAHPNQVDMELKAYPHHYWNSAEKKGYSGTAIFSKIEPLSVQYDMGIEKHDKEGRVITLEFEKFYLITVYTPNAKRSLERLPYRYDEWDPDFLAFCKNLEKEKPVIFCGDLNVAHTEIDIKNAKSNMTTEKRPGNAGFTDQERERFDDIIKAGYIDTFRYFYPDKEHVYTWWSYMFNARKNNVGWRIDYFCASKKLEKQLKDAKVYMDVMGSDHCPVGLELK